MTKKHEKYEKRKWSNELRQTISIGVCILRFIRADNQIMWPEKKLTIHDIYLLHQAETQ